MIALSKRKIKPFFTICKSGYITSFLYWNRFRFLVIYTLVFPADCLYFYIVTPRDSCFLEQGGYLFLVVVKAQTRFPSI